MLVIALLVILTMSSPKLFAKKFRVHVENNKRNEIQTVNTSLYQLDANHFLKNLVSLIRLNEIPKLLRRRMFTHSICKALISTALKNCFHELASKLQFFRFTAEHETSSGRHPTALRC